MSATAVFSNRALYKTHVVTMSNASNTPTRKAATVKLEWTTDHRDWYRNVYLKSDHWKRLSAAKLFVDPKCQRCGKTDRLEPHHIEYKNIFDVTLDDLETLCRKCHTEEHDKNGMPKRDRSKFATYEKKEVVKPKRKDDGGKKFEHRSMAAYLLCEGKCVACNAAVDAATFRGASISKDKSSVSLANIAIVCGNCDLSKIPKSVVERRISDMLSRCKQSHRTDMVFRALSKKKEAVRTTTLQDVEYEMEHQNEPQL